MRNMASAQTESDQPSDDKRVHKPDKQEVATAFVDCNADVCARDSAEKEATESDVVFSQASDNSSPHGADVSPCNKDAAEPSRNPTSAEVAERKMDMPCENNNSELVSDESRGDFGVESRDPRDASTVQKADKEDIENKTTENLSTDSKHTREEKDETLKQDEKTIDVSEEKECNGETMQGKKVETDETGDSSSMEKVEQNTEERGGEDESKTVGTGLVVKQRKSCLECRECGKKFTRREMSNLHRNFHMHQNEQASLSCKECGITFQHRSDLIKHRSMHRKDIQPGSESKVSHLQLGRKFLCEHCGLCFSTVVRLRLHACEQKLEKPFRCPLCRKEFQYRVSINAHMQSHSLDSPFRCLECTKGFQSVATLYIHQRSHASLKPYECPDCHMVFRHRYVMEDHRRRHREGIPHMCKICGKTFRYANVLQQHQYLHTGQKPYHCPYCGKKFAFGQNMRAHCLQHKRNTYSRSEARNVSCNASHGRDLEEMGKENANHPMEQQRNCPLCPQIFYKAADLRVHMLIHEAEYERMSNDKKFYKVYACRHCPLKFPTESTLQFHATTHQTNVLGTTSHITNQFKAAPVKREPVNVDMADNIDNMSGGGELGDHSDRKPFRCKDCGKCFRYRSVLELHMRIHNKGFQCQVCKKSFKFNSYLQQHSIIHTGKKPYKCPDCGKDFAFYQNMRTHQRLHQQKPFRCTQCRKGYSDESQLQRHMLSHTGEKPHKCNLCDKSFALAYLLRDHLNTHTGERPHRCQECNKSFPWLSSLLVHQKIHMRKRQNQSHNYPLSIHSQRSREKGYASRGRRWPKLERDMERSVPLQQDPQFLPNVVQQQSHIFNVDMQEHVQLRSQQQLQNFQVKNHSQTVQLQQEWQLQIQPSSKEMLHRKSVVEARTADPLQMQWSGSNLRAILPKCEGLPELRHQKQPARADVAELAQPSLATNDYSEIISSPEGETSLLTNKTPPVVSFTPNQAKCSENELEQKGTNPSLWMNTPNSTQQRTSPEPSHPIDRNSSLDVNMQSPRSMSQSSLNQLINIEDPQHSQWSVLSDSMQTTKQKLFNKSIENGKTSIDVEAQTTNESDKPIHVREDNLQIQKSFSLAKTAVLTEMGQSGGVISTSPSSLQNTNPWGLKTSLEMSTTVNLQEIPGNALEKQNRQIQQLPSQQMLVAQQPSQQMQQLQQQLLQQNLHQPQLQQQHQLPHTWVSMTPSNQIGPMNMQYASARFPLGDRSNVWGFQTTPVVTQTILNGPVQHGHIRTQQHVAIISGQQIPLNQPPPFISPSFPPPPPPLNLPAPHPVHSVGRHLPGPLPQGVFFTSQGSINELSLMPQVTPLQTEPHKIGNKMPFAADHHVQCMICGCSLPGELELQMHYMQHAQGEV